MPSFQALNHSSTDSLVPAENIDFGRHSMCCIQLQAPQANALGRTDEDCHWIDARLVRFEAEVGLAHK